MTSPAGEGGRLLVLAGLSVRYLAEAAVQAGWQVLALDCFGDRDTRRVSRHWQSIASAEGLAIDPARLRSALAEAAVQPGVAGWLAGAGLEADPALLDAGGRALPRLGLATGEVLALRDPRRFFAVLDAAGLRHPAFSLRAPLRPEGWWHKRAGGCGGAHIRPASLPGPLAPDSYFQRHQPGDPRSALFLADGRQAMVVALNRQHTRAEPPPEPAATATATATATARPCLWIGVSGPLRVPALQAQVQAALAVLVPAFGLRGLMSLDFIATGDQAHWLEINPRPSASLQLYPEAYADGLPAAGQGATQAPAGGLMAAHLAALQGRLPAEAPVLGTHWRGVRVVFAQRAVEFDGALSDALAHRSATHDLPAPGGRLEPGLPLCSVSARASTAQQLDQQLDERVAAVLHTCHSLEGTIP